MSMLIIGFCLGYGAPLIIATITIAATAPSNQYIRENVVCWLNWDGSKALLGFVIPALMIVVINLIILIVVIAKLLRRRVGENAAQAGEKHVLVVIARSLAVLTPFFGLTWGFLHSGVRNTIGQNGAVSINTISTSYLPRQNNQHRYWNPIQWSWKLFQETEKRKTFFEWLPCVFYCTHGLQHLIQSKDNDINNTINYNQRKKGQTPSSCFKPNI
ncbi:hypothetical protein ATANTOWER_010280 [Ataeniobius toweri]|uniref:G-protein coupled receptors family 2 profile 2 domain-containing protein n=1 Tax=Ataeniobius toweri TaxID=208326 RepID=A0ABU7BZH3_9TELE|nr:hypothetical protein [Ataeniobius toweri]